MRKHFRLPLFKDPPKTGFFKNENNEFKEPIQSYQTQGRLAIKIMCVSFYQIIQIYLKNKSFQDSILFSYIELYPRVSAEAVEG